MSEQSMEEWGQQVTEQVFDKLRDSTLSITIFDGNIDWKIAIETGAAVLMDKPIVLVVKPGTPLPENLVKIAYRIIEGSLETYEARGDLAAKIAEVVSSLREDER